MNAFHDLHIPSLLTFDEVVSTILDLLDVYFNYIVEIGMLRKYRIRVLP